MKLHETMILWTPNRQPHINNPNIGCIAITTIPEPKEYRQFTSSYGACNYGWSQFDDALRFSLFTRAVTNIIEMDFLDTRVVADAIREIEDIRVNWAKTFLRISSRSNPNLFFYRRFKKLNHEKTHVIGTKTSQLYV